MAASELRRPILVEDALQLVTFRFRPYGLIRQADGRDLSAKPWEEKGHLDRAR